MSEKLVSSRQAAAQEDVHFRVMRLLEANPDMSQRDLAAHVGISLGSLNYCLKALMDKGFVKLENFQNSKHKFKYVYILTPAGIAQKVALTGRFLKRKMQEYEALKAEIEGLEAELVGRETYGLSEVSKPYAKGAK
jgi:EPS-associated MarR family transcriptional regulator